MKPLRLCLLLLPLVLGCGAPVPEPTGAEAPPIVSHFDPQTAGTIHGRVTWTGDVPQVAPFFVLSEEIKAKTYMPNVGTPAVDAGTRGVANAVVFLRGVELQKACPWNEPKVIVESRYRPGSPPPAGQRWPDRTVERSRLFLNAGVSIRGRPSLLRSYGFRRAVQSEPGSPWPVSSRLLAAELERSRA